MKNKVVTFGEIMLRLSTPQHQRIEQAHSFESSFGGGEANVAVSLSKFGMYTEFMSCLPANEIGDACLQELRKHNVGVTHILRGSERLGIYFLEHGASGRPSNVIYDRSNSAIANIKPDNISWETILKDATWFHISGITPALSQGAADTCLAGLKIANKLDITVSCDLNYRKKLWNYGKSAQEVMPEIISHCDIVLGNEEDAMMVLGLKKESIHVEKGEINTRAFKEISEQIIEQFPRVKKVITTLRTSINANHNKWSGLLYDGKDLLEGRTYDITHIVDRVGSGDAFMAGIIFGLLNFNNDQKTLEFAIAASCLKHTIPGDFNLVSADEVIKLMQGDGSGRVVR